MIFYLKEKRKGKKEKEHVKNIFNFSKGYLWDVLISYGRTINKTSKT